MSTTSLTAGEVMDRSAALLNDPQKTDYTYTAQLPYLNMAIDELVESLEESNSPVTNHSTSSPIVLPVGKNKITPFESLETPHYPIDLVEIQEVAERTAGSQNSFIPLVRREFVQPFPAADSFLFWTWEDQSIKFNPSGATAPREIQLKYIRQAITQAVDETGVIGTINARSYLAYKTASLCAQFVGENETRAALLDEKAERALERITGITNKGKQQMMTRHRPFRAGYKSRGWM
jgi:hypothetical protein